MSGRIDESKQKVSPQNQPPPSREHSTSLSRESLTSRQWIQLIGQSPTEPLEALFGFGFTLWGFWVMLPFWQVSDLAPSVYRLLLMAVKDEYLLGLACLLVGLSLTFSMFWDNKKARYYSCVAFTSLSGAFMVSFLFSDYRSPAFLWWGLYTASGWWMMTRTRERYESHEEEKAKRKS